MRLLSLFTGIGGFDLAAEWLGWEVACQVEIDDFCYRVLEKHWLNVERHRDIREFDGTVWRGRVDLVCGGFPCQDISIAGKGAGLDGERSGLWFDMLRVIREARPRWVVAENVNNLYHQGIDTVLGGLEEAGYSCWPLVVGADDVGAPHRRKRVWIVGRLADAAEPRLSSGTGSRGNDCAGRQDRRTSLLGASGQSALADPGDGQLPQSGRRPQGRDGAGPAGAGVDNSLLRRHRDAQKAVRAGRNGVEPSSAVADADRRNGDGRTCGVQMGRGGIARDDEEDRAGDDEPATLGGLGRAVDGLSAGLDFPGWPARPGCEQFSWEASRTVKGQKDRAKRLKSLGNSICPQAGYVILRAIAEAERTP